MSRDVRILTAAEAPEARQRARRKWVEEVRRSSLDAKTQRFLAIDCLPHWYGNQNQAAT